MRRSRSTKRALLASVMSLIVCVAMLIGTTFAWFTDSVTTGKNTVQAGNLDVGLYSRQLKSNSTTEYEYVPVGKETSLFDENTLWEPGHTEVVYLKVANLGKLALKYKLAVTVESETKGTNVAGDEFELSDYLVFGMVPGKTETIYADRSAARVAAGSTMELGNYSYNENVLYPASANDTEKDSDKPSEEYIALVVYMPESVGNEANYKTGKVAPSITLGVTLIAKQYTYEEDSFDDQYDAAVSYPVMNAPELREAVKKAEEYGGIITLGADIALDEELEVPSSESSSVSSSVSLDLGTNKITNTSNNTIGIKLIGNGNKVSITAATTGGISMNNQPCIVVTGVGATTSEITVDGGTYSVTGSTNPYLIDSNGSNWGSDHVTIQNVTYTGACGVRFIHGENDTIDIKDCTFHVTGNGGSTSAIYIGCNHVCNLENVTIDGANTAFGIFAANTGHTNTQKEYSVINIKSGTYNCSLHASTNCTISITGGSFSNDPKDYLAEGYAATYNAETDMWDVTAAN